MRRNENYGLPLPYDGITRTGSKGLSQLRQCWRGTPNVSLQVTGIADFKQDSIDSVGRVSPQGVTRHRCSQHNQVIVTIVSGYTLRANPTYGRAASTHLSTQAFSETVPVG